MTTAVKTNGKKGIFEGGFGRFIVPGIVLQSVLIGGGYSTGREVVAYGAKFGALGWISGISIMVGFGLMAFLMFETARLFRAYDYRSLVKQFLGPLWFLYDIIYILLAILIVAIVIAATASILERTLGIHYIVGIVGIAVIAGFLNFYGTRLIERFQTIGTIALFVGYLIFAGLVISNTWDHAAEVFASNDTRFAGDFSSWSLVWTGIIYVGYNLAVYPAALFTVKRQRSVKETLIGGAVAGVLMTLPWFLTYFALLGSYPSKSVFDADVPWLEMLDGYGTWVVVIFGVVVGWTLIETATGMVHAFLDRVNNNLQEIGKRPLSQSANGLLAIAFLAVSAVVGTIGISHLVDTGYTWLGYAMLIVYGLPILTIGVYRIVQRNRRSQSRISAAE